MSWYLQCEFSYPTMGRLQIPLPTCLSRWAQWRQTNFPVTLCSSRFQASEKRASEGARLEWAKKWGEKCGGGEQEGGGDGEERNRLQSIPNILTNFVRPRTGSNSAIWLVKLARQSKNDFRNLSFMHNPASGTQSNFSNTRRRLHGYHGYWHVASQICLLWRFCLWSLWYNDKLFQILLLRLALGKAPILTKIFGKTKKIRSSTTLPVVYLHFPNFVFKWMTDLTVKRKPIYVYYLF